MDNIILVGFGDSWTYGSELEKPKEQNWLYHLSVLLNCKTVNMSTPASGVEHTVVQLFDFIQNTQHTTNKKIFAVGLSGLTRYLSYSNRLEELSILLMKQLIELKISRLMVALPILFPSLIE